MRDTDHFKKHMTVETEIQHGAEPIEHVSSTPIEDPFHTTNVYFVVSLWTAFKMLLFPSLRNIRVRVKVRGDGVAIGRWMQGADICEKCKRTRIDGPGKHTTKPGYEHADERWCEACYYSAPVPGVVAHGIPE